MGTRTRNATGRIATTLAVLASGTAVVLTGGVAPAGAVGYDAGMDVGAFLPPPALADVDGDRVSDEFEADLLALPLDAPVDVIVRTSDADASASFDGAVPLSLIGGFAATMTAADALDLAADTATIRVERDGKVRLTDDGGRADHGVDRAQGDLGVTGAGVAICVIDSGIDPNHEQLDDGKVVGWIDLVQGLSTPYDDHNNGVGGHGTHVASIAAGDGVGASPLAARYRGVAPEASLYVAKAFPGALPDLTPDAGQESVTIQAIEWCVAQPAVDIISMSFTLTGPSDGTDALAVAALAAIDAGKVAVAAAGNDGPNPGLLGSPGSAERVLTVGAVADWSLPVTAANRSEGPFLPAFSSRGPTADGRVKPDVVAPGHTVLAAASNTGAGYLDKSGTSMATPFVAGAVALALEANPALSHDDLKALVLGTAIDRGVTGKDIDWGSGLLDVFGVVSSADGSSVYEPTAFPTNTVLTGTTVGGEWTHEFELTATDLDVPIAATVLIDGAPDASGAFWDPDLQVSLHDPAGVQLDFSNCPLLLDANDCLGNTPQAGRQELVHSLPTIAGTYVLTVSDAAASSGSFTLDLTHGPVEDDPLPGTCTVVWTGAGDGSTWAVPTNWSTNVTPLPTDVVCIPAAGDVHLGLAPTSVRAVIVDGSLSVESPADLTLTDVVVPSDVSGRLLIGAGATVATAIELELHGILSGAGELDGSLANRGDVLPGGTGVGTLTITGTYRQTPAGVLSVDVDGTAPSLHDVLVVHGSAELAGVLAVDNGVVPDVGDDVEILDVGTARTGTFSELRSSDPSPPTHWELDDVSDAPDVHLVAVAGPPPPPDNQVTICHKPGTPAEKTMSLPPKAAASHQRAHGDRPGPC